MPRRIHPDSVTPDPAPPSSAPSASSGNRPPELPGYLIRRAQQQAVALFMEETQDFGVTPVQYGMLSILDGGAGLDQASLARLIAFDPATSGSVIERLEAKGFIERHVDPADRRRKLLEITPEGRRTLRRMRPGVMRAQRRMLDPLDDEERTLFLSMLRRITQERDHG